MNRFIAEKLHALEMHVKYQWLCHEVENAYLKASMFGWERIAAEDFLERLEAMPATYIRDWLDGYNNLEWTENFKRRLMAIRGGYLELLEANPLLEIHRISVCAKDFYLTYLGFQLVHEDAAAKCVYVGKPIAV